ncbi:MAG TPA: GWxTD domain-containing protein [Candidatus Kryptonia bacterium]
MFSKVGTVAIFSMSVALLHPDTSRSQSKFLSAVNFSEFRYDSTLTCVELYTALSPAKLAFHSAEKVDTTTALVASAKLIYQFTNVATDSAFTFSDEIPISISDTSSISGSSKLVTITRLLFRPGRYSGAIYAEFGDSTTVLDSANLRLEVRNFPGSMLTLSDIELCSEISNETSDKDVYGKNTLHVVPNPKAIYGLGMPVLSSYAEVYGLAKRADSTEYAITWNVIDTYGRIVKSRSSHGLGTSTSLVELGSMNISDLASGKYAVELLVADSVSRGSAFSSQYFFVYNPYVKQPPTPAGTNVDVISSPFFTMGGEELDDLFHAASYLASPQQSSFYQKLETLDAKRAFMAQFWNEQNRKEGFGGFNSWAEFDKRFTYVNQKYKTAFRAGWLTDRGRVYIDYGQPDDIDRHPSTAGSKPYEIWSYNGIENGVVFIFADLTGFNNYALIHSTKQGEVDDPDWQRYVQTDQ